MAYATERVKEEYSYRCGLKYAELTKKNLPFDQLVEKIREGYKRIWQELAVEENLRKRA